MLGKNMIKLIWFYFTMIQIVVQISAHYKGVSFPLNAHECIKTIQAVINLEAIPREKISIWTITQFNTISITYKLLISAAIIVILTSAACLFCLFRRHEPAHAKHCLSRLSHMIFFNPMIRLGLVFYLTCCLFGVRGVKSTVENYFFYDYEYVSVAWLALQWSCLLACAGAIIASCRTLGQNRPHVLEQKKV